MLFSFISFLLFLISKIYNVVLWYSISPGLEICVFSGCIGFKVKMHHFEQLARRVASKSVECCDFCWISGPQVKMALQRNWNNRKQLETVGNSWKQSEIVGNSWERPGMIMPILSPRIFLRQNSFHAIPLIVWRSSGKRLEAVGALCVWVGRKRIIDFT